MSIDNEDAALAQQMRELLAYAGAEMPESIICIFSFTASITDPRIQINKVATNVDAREPLIATVRAMLTAMEKAVVYDFTDCQGGMQ